MKYNIILGHHIMEAVMYNLTLTLLSWSTDLNLVPVFVIRSVTILPYNMGSPYLAHILIVEGRCQPSICHLTLTSFQVSLTIKFTSSFLWLDQTNIFGPLIDHYVIKFVSDLRQVDGFLRVLWFPPPIKLTSTI
jgi:hypothetical protein